MRLVIVFCFSLSLICSAVQAGVIEGTVCDFDSGEAIARASLRVEGTGHAMIANEEGRYRIRLDNGTYNLTFSHIGYYSDGQTVEVTDEGLSLDIRLHPSMIVIKGTKVYSRAYDAAQRIIIEAIKRKQALLNRTHDYSFDAYTKVIINNISRPDSVEVLMIAESQVEGHWEQPDKFKEIIKARKQTANIEAANNLISVGGILNFNKNRLDFGKYSVVSPVARDALDHYNYYLMDTLYIDSLAVFRLEIEPKNNYEPLFIGTIDIADSSYAVVGVDVTFSEGFELQMVDSLHYVQVYERFEVDRWMPIEIRLFAELNIPIPLIPRIAFDYVAALSNYRFDLGIEDDVFDEYVLEVAPEADEVDSTTWLSRQLVPMTVDELDAYRRIDSVESAPKPLPQQLVRIGLGAVFVAMNAYDIFHFNRVEGAYVGLGIRPRDVLPGLDLHLRSGYAIDGDYWQHRYGLRYRLLEKPRVHFNFEYHDQIAHRPTMFSAANFNPTFVSLMSKFDQLDYYLEKGFTAGIDIRPIRQTTLSVAYHDYNQYSVANSTNYSLFRTDTDHRLNPAVADGKLRSVSAALRWDNRELMKDKGRERILGGIPYTIAELGIEYAAPDFIDNDFDFRRYYASLYRVQRMPGLGITSLYCYAGSSDDVLPPQRYITVDYVGELMPEDLSFKTLGEVNFHGDRTAAVYVEHDFGAMLFRRSGIPLIRDIPLSLSGHGGVFWAEFERQENIPADAMVWTAGKPFGEIGFALGNLPLGIKLFFTWQLSDYDTETFSFDFNMFSF